MSNSRAKPWLVEIRVKDWIRVPEGHSRVIGYEEVLAHNQIEARHAGFDQFVRRSKYEPVSRRRLADRMLETSDFCAPDAVELDS